MVCHILGLQLQQSHFCAHVLFIQSLVVSDTHLFYFALTCCHGDGKYTEGNLQFVGKSACRRFAEIGDFSEDAFDFPTAKLDLRDA